MTNATSGNPHPSILIILPDGVRPVPRGIAAEPRVECDGCRIFTDVLSTFSTRELSLSCGLACGGEDPMINKYGQSSPPPGGELEKRAKYRCAEHIHAFGT